MNTEHLLFSNMISLGFKYLQTVSTVRMHPISVKYSSNKQILWQCVLTCLASHKTIQLKPVSHTLSRNSRPGRLPQLLSVDPSICSQLSLSHTLQAHTQPAVQPKPQLATILPSQLIHSAHSFLFTILQFH